MTHPSNPQTAAEKRRQWDERHALQAEQKWRDWVRGAASLVIFMFFVGGVIVRSAVHESPTWWFGGVLVLIALVGLLLITPVTIIDWYRDGRDFIQWRLFVRKERKQR